MSTIYTKLHYVKDQDDSLQYYYDVELVNRSSEIEWILDQGYELVGES